MEARVNAVTDTVRNGVDTERMFATLALVQAQPELAKLQFRATDRLVDGSRKGAWCLLGQVVLAQRLASLARAGQVLAFAVVGELVASHGDV
jgi:hypothetical protein